MRGNLRESQLWWRCSVLGMLYSLDGQTDRLSVPATEPWAREACAVDESWDWRSMCGKDSVDYEAYWISRFWVPLDADGYDILAGKIPARRQSRWSKWTTNVSLLRAAPGRPGFNESWTLIRDKEVPSSPGGPLFRPTLVKALIEKGPFETAFEAHDALHRSIPRESWKRLRTLSPQSFDCCTLAYVELGAILNLYFSAPCGVVDRQVQSSLLEKFGQRSDLRIKCCHWITGCLLQHAEAPSQPLIDLCVNKLGYLPGRAGILVGTKKMGPGLQCLRPYPAPFTYHGDNPAAALQETLSQLPVVSVDEYSNLTATTLLPFLLERQPAVVGQGAGSQVGVSQATMFQVAAASSFGQEVWDQALEECLSTAAFHDEDTHEGSAAAWGPTTDTWGPTDAWAPATNTSGPTDTWGPTTNTLVPATNTLGPTDTWGPTTNTLGPTDTWGPTTNTLGPTDTWGPTMNTLGPTDTWGPMTDTLGPTDTWGPMTDTWEPMWGPMTNTWGLAMNTLGPMTNTWGPTVGWGTHLLHGPRRLEADEEFTSNHSIQKRTMSQEPSGTARKRFAPDRSLATHERAPAIKCLERHS